jgi:hypothetical protein
LEGEPVEEFFRAGLGEGLVAQGVHVGEAGEEIEGLVTDLPIAEATCAIR